MWLEERIVMAAEAHSVGGDCHCVAKLQGEHTKAHESENMSIRCITMKEAHERL